MPPLLPDPFVKVWMRFPPGLSREVVNDRIHLLAAGRLTLRDAEAALDSWDIRDIPEATDGR